MNMDTVRSLKQRIDSSLLQHVSARRRSSVASVPHVADDTSSSILNAQSHSLHESVAGARLMGRSEIVDTSGYQNDLVLLMLYDHEWVPVVPDFSKKLRNRGGLVASGFPLTVDTTTTTTTAASPRNKKFRLEIPHAGNVTRVFLRYCKENDVKDRESSPSYRQAPFLIFVNDVLCVRHLPAHALLASSKSVLKNEGKTWERLELRAPFYSYYNKQMSTTEHQAAFLLCGGRHKPVKFDGQHFVLQTKKNRKRTTSSDSSNKSAQDANSDRTTSEGTTTTSSGSVDPHTWFALARLGDEDDREKEMVEMTKKGNDAVVVIKEKEEDASAAESTLMSTASSVINVCWAHFTLFFLVIFSKLGLGAEPRMEQKEVKKKALPETEQPQQQDNKKRSMTEISDLTNDDDEQEEEKKDATDKVLQEEERKEEKPNVCRSEDSPFDFKESIVTDKHTGEVLSPTTVVRGSVRCETLVFYCASRLINLTRCVLTTKKLGFKYINVGMDSMELGTFEIGKHEHVLPPQEVPSTVLAKGVYKVNITYTADNVEQEILREESVEFCIV